MTHCELGWQVQEGSGSPLERVGEENVPPCCNLGA